MDNKFEVRLNEQQVNVVLQALQELPYRVASEVIETIIEQLRAQAQSTPERAPEDNE